MVLACSCQPSNGSSGSGNVAVDPPTSAPFVSKSPDSNPKTNLNSSEEDAVVNGAIQEFFTSRWSDWNVGEFIAVEPSWGNCDFPSFDKALEHWTTKFGNDGNTDEETLKRIKSTLETANAPPSPQKGNVDKSLPTMELDVRVIIVPSTFFNEADPWVPGAVTFTNRNGKVGSIRTKGTLCYPMFSGDGHYGFMQMSHVKSGREYGQLHFFLEKADGKWRALAVGRIGE